MKVSAKPFLSDYDTSEKKKEQNNSKEGMWFNPPFSLNMKTNVRKISLKFVKRHFPKRTPSAQDFR